MSVGSQLREEAIAAKNGFARAHSGGWSIVMTGGPNDAIGNLSDPPLWRLSGKRLDGGKPSDANLDYLRRVALEAGFREKSDERRMKMLRGEEMIVGTWHYTWNEADGAAKPDQEAEAAS